MKSLRPTPLSPEQQSVSQRWMLALLVSKSVFFLSFMTYVMLLWLAPGTVSNDITTKWLAVSLFGNGLVQTIGYDRLDRVVNNRRGSLRYRTWVFVPVLLVILIYCLTQ